MRLLPLGMALTLLGTGAVFAATPPSTPATAPTPTAMPAAHRQTKDCAKEAAHEKLAGKAREDFIRKCRNGEESK